MSTPPFSLSRATVADLTELVALQYHCFSDYVREVFMGCKSEDDLPRAVGDFRHILESDPHDTWIKVTDTATGKIVSGSNWKIYPNSAPISSDDKPMPWLQGAELEQSKKMLDSMNEKRRLANRNGYVHLHICFTDAAYRRRGAGWMMMKWGCDLADQLFLPAWVEASKEGSALYRTFGFYDYEHLNEPLPGVNMKRDPITTGIQGGQPKPQPGT